MKKQNPLSILFAGESASVEYIDPRAAAKLKFPTQVFVRALPLEHLHQVLSTYEHPHLFVQLCTYTRRGAARSPAGLFPDVAPPSGYVAVPAGWTLNLTDATFTAVDHVWLERMVAWSDSFLRATSKTYTPESFDCDKFAKAFTLGVEWVASDAGVRAQPLVARLYVLLPTGGGHAVVGFRSERGLFVLEPQPGGVGPRLVPLADYRATIFRVRLGG